MKYAMNTFHAEICPVFSICAVIQVSGVHLFCGAVFLVIPVRW